MKVDGTLNTHEKISLRHSTPKQDKSTVQISNLIAKPRAKGLDFKLESKAGALISKQNLKLRH